MTHRTGAAPGGGPAVTDSTAEQPASLTQPREAGIDIRRYYARFRLSNPARMAVRRSTPMLVAAMRRYFSGRVLDIGCGAKDKALLADVNVEEYVGLDHRDSTHDPSNVDIFGSAYDIPSTDGSFDGVLCTAVLEHLEEPQRALEEALRVLRPGGHAIYTIPFFWHLHEEPRDFYRYTRYGIAHLFETAGFEIVELHALSGFWVTVGSEFSAYLQHWARGPIRPLVNLVVAMINVIVPPIDRWDLRVNPGSERWTWCHLVVARKAS